MFLMFFSSEWTMPNENGWFYEVLKESNQSKTGLFFICGGIHSCYDVLVISQEDTNRKSAWISWSRSSPVPGFCALTRNWKCWWTFSGREVPCCRIWTQVGSSVYLRQFHSLAPPPPPLFTSSSYFSHQKQRTS